jgi:serine/threonine-protein kinase HipA
MAHSSQRLAQSYQGATHIVKLWEPNEYPQLAANEHFCLTAARKCGLEVPPYRLSEDGLALSSTALICAWMAPCGFEDFCVLNARRTDEKYRGSYETSVTRRFAQFANSPHVHEDMEKLFTLIALNCALRNGDAHLKNFGIVYEDVQGEARLAPVYDLVTTCVYLPKDSLALTLNGTTQWPTAKALRKLGETRAGGTPAKIRQILARVAEAMLETGKEVRAYMKRHPEFAEIGGRLLEEWETGSGISLRGKN